MKKLIKIYKIFFITFILGFLIQGWSDISLDQLINKYDLLVDRNLSAILRLYNAKFEIKVLLFSPYIIVNEKSYLIPPPYIKGGTIYFSEKVHSILENIHKNLFLSPFNNYVIVIDPGHGGKDPGAIANGIKEKNLVLDVARRVSHYLCSPLIKVILTRTDDYFITLKQRALIANRSGADIFISIHANKAPSPKAKGIETFYVASKYTDVERGRLMQIRYNLKDKFPYINNISPLQERRIYQLLSHHTRRESKVLARFIQKYLKGGLHTIDRGTKEGYLYVLKWSPCPAVLIEIGFLSNKYEAACLRKSKYRDKIAFQISRAIKEYIKTTYHDPRIK